MVKSTQDDDIWMEIIPIQHDVYIWANYSVPSSLDFIPIFWNALIWLKYDFMHIFMHHISLYFNIYSLRPLRRYRKLNTGENTDIWGQILIFWGHIRIFAFRTSNQHWLSYYWTRKNEHIATKYVINMFIFVCNDLITHSSSMKLHDMDKFIIAIAAEILQHINGKFTMGKLKSSLLS